MRTTLESMSELVSLGALHPKLTRLERPRGGPGCGLSRALGDRFGIDPLLIRVGFIMLTLTGGVGVVAYSWGTLLTSRTGHHPPILRLVPAFSGWGPRTQWLMIASTSVLAIAMASQITPASIFPLLVLIALLLFRRRRNHSTTSDDQEATATPEDELPVVDLYAPEESVEFPPPSTHPAPRRRSWLGGLLVLLTGGLATALVVALQPSHDPLMLAAIILGTTGAAILLWGLLAGSRGLPLTVLLLTLLASTAVAALATYRATEEANPPAASDALTYQVVASSQTVDLRHLPTGEPTEVHVSATASHVQILLPARPATYDLALWLSEVNSPEGRVSSRNRQDASGLHLILRGSLSTFDVEYPR